MQSMYDSDKRKWLSILCHGSVFFSSLIIPILIPITVLFISDDPIVKGSAKEAINLQLNVWVYGAFIGFLFFILIGYLIAWPLIPILFIFHWTLPILAIMNKLSKPDEVYRYPFIFRVVS